MNKYKELTKQTVKMTVMVLIIVGVAGAVFAAISMASDSVEKSKTDAENKLRSDTDLLTSLRSQLDKSGVAEKSFVSIQLDRANPDFSASLEALKEVLRNDRQQYGFGQFSLTPVNELPTDKPDLANFNFNITVRPRLKLTIQAISDLHIYSFIDDLQRTAPGLIRIESLSMKRLKDLDDTTLNNARGGQMTMLVEATLEFTQIGVTPKEVKTPAGGAAAAGAVTSPAAAGVPPAGPGK